ncbi:MAG TPA: methyltransferase domain-containing protein, partial [Verrucomicrobiae bacterium]|nr:methyltransferase domain-containing protein [Verrucomicrobiae bacterium]
MDKVPQPEKRKTHFLTRVIAAFSLVCFAGTQTPALPAASASSVSPEPTVSKSFPSDLAQLTLPGNFGKVEEIFQGKDARRVIVVQDAHAVPEAQKNIGSIIAHLRREHGLGLVAAEGAVSRLDLDFFKSFPDKEILQKTFQDYSESGELTGATAALLAADDKDHPCIFEGLEDWPLYEDGLRLYLQALKSEPDLRQKIAAGRKDLGEKKESVYSPRLLELDRVLQSFRQNETGLLEVLKALAVVRKPEAGSEIALLLEQASRGDAVQSSLDAEVKKMARDFKAFLDAGQFPAEERIAFNKHEQDFLTSLESAESFAIYLKERSEKLGAGIEWTGALSAHAAREKRLRDLEGTKFFKELEAYTASVKEELFRNEEERRLDAESRGLDLAARAAVLELTRGEWEEWKNTPAADDPAYRAPRAFYENAESRDRIFFRNIEALMKRHSQDVSLVVAGGFHAQGMAQALRERGISYALVRPEIAQLPETNSYRDQMQGRFSWRSYFQNENGRVSVYKAFVRAARDKLLDRVAPAEQGRVIKEWRDTIVRDAAVRNDLAGVGQDTHFLDELSGDAGPLWLKKVEHFAEQIRQWDSAHQLTQDKVMGLLHPAMTQSLAGAIGAPRVWASADVVYGIRTEAETVKAEIRPEAAAKTEAPAQAAAVESRPELRAWISRTIVMLVTAALVAVLAGGLPRGVQPQAGAQRAERARAYYDIYLDRISKETYTSGRGFDSKQVPYSLKDRLDAVRVIAKAHKDRNIRGGDYELVTGALDTGMGLSAARVERAAYGNKNIDELTKELAKKRKEGVKLSEDDDALKAAKSITDYYLADIQPELNFQYEAGQALLATGMTRENVQAYVNRLVKPSVYKGYLGKFEKDLYPQYFLADPKDKELKRVQAALTKARDRNIDGLKGVSAALEKQYNFADKEAKAARTKVETLESEAADAKTKMEAFAVDLERQRRLLNGDRETTSVKGYVQAKEELEKEQKQLTRDKKFAEARKLEEKIQGIAKDIRDTKRKEQEASDGRAREEKRMRKAQLDLLSARTDAARLEKEAKAIEDTFAEVRDALDDRRKRSELRAASEESFLGAGLKEVRPELRAPGEEAPMELRLIDFSRARERAESFQTGAAETAARPEMRGLWRAAVMLLTAGLVVTFSAGLPRNVQPKLGAQYKKEERQRAYYDTYLDRLTKEGYETGPAYDRKIVPWSDADRSDAVAGILKAQKDGHLRGTDYDLVLRSLSSAITRSNDRIERAVYSKDIEKQADEIAALRKKGVKVEEDDDALAAAKKITDLYVAAAGRELKLQEDLGKAILGMGVTTDTMDAYMKLVRSAAYKSQMEHFDKNLYPKFFLADPKEVLRKRVEKTFAAARDANITRLSTVVKTLEARQTSAKKDLAAAQTKVETLEAQEKAAKEKAETLKDDLERVQRLLHGDKDSTAVFGLIQAKKDLEAEQKQLTRDKKFAEARKLEDKIQDVAKDIREAQRKEKEVKDARGDELAKEQKAKLALFTERATLATERRRAESVTALVDEVKDLLADLKKRSELRGEEETGLHEPYRPELRAIDVRNARTRLLTAEKETLGSRLRAGYEAVARKSGVSHWLLDLGAGNGELTSKAVRRPDRSVVFDQTYAVELDAGRLQTFKRLYMFPGAQLIHGDFFDVTEQLEKQKAKFRAAQFAFSVNFIPMADRDRLFKRVIRLVGEDGVIAFVLNGKNREQRNQVMARDQLMTKHRVTAVDADTNFENVFQEWGHDVRVEHVVVPHETASRDEMIQLVAAVLPEEDRNPVKIARYVDANLQVKERGVYRFEIHFDIVWVTVKPKVEAPKAPTVQKVLKDFAMPILGAGQRLGFWEAGGKYYTRTGTDAFVEILPGDVGNAVKTMFDRAAAARGARPVSIAFQAGISDDIFLLGLQHVMDSASDAVNKKAAVKLYDTALKDDVKLKMAGDDSELLDALAAIGASVPQIRIERSELRAISADDKAFVQAVALMGLEHLPRLMDAIDTLIIEHGEEVAELPRLDFGKDLPKAARDALDGETAAEQMEQVLDLPTSETMLTALKALFGITGKGAREKLRNPGLVTLVRGLVTGESAEETVQPPQLKEDAEFAADGNSRSVPVLIRLFWPRNGHEILLRIKKDQKPDTRLPPDERVKLHKGWTYTVRVSGDLLSTTVEVIPRDQPGAYVADKVDIHAVPGEYEGLEEDLGTWANGLVGTAMTPSNPKLRGELRASSAEAEPALIEAWKAAAPIPLQDWQIELMKSSYRLRQAEEIKSRDKFYSTMKWLAVVSIVALGAKIGTALGMIAAAGLANIAVVFLVGLPVAYFLSVIVHEFGHWAMQRILDRAYEKKTGKPLSTRNEIFWFPPRVQIKNNGLAWKIGPAMAVLAAAGLLNLATALVLLVPGYFLYQAFGQDSLLLAGIAVNVLANFTGFLRNLVEPGDHMASDREQLLQLLRIRGMLRQASGLYDLGEVEGVWMSSHYFMMQDGQPHALPGIAWKSPDEYSFYVRTDKGIYHFEAQLLGPSVPERDFLFEYSLPEHWATVPYRVKGRRIEGREPGVSEFDFRGTKISVYKIDLPPALQPKEAAGRAELRTADEEDAATERLAAAYMARLAKGKADDRIVPAGTYRQGLTFDEARAIPFTRMDMTSLYEFFVFMSDTFGKKTLAAALAGHPELAARRAEIEARYQRLFEKTLSNPHLGALSGAQHGGAVNLIVKELTGDYDPYSEISGRIVAAFDALLHDSGRFDLTARAGLPQVPEARGKIGPEAANALYQSFVLTELSGAAADTVLLGVQKAVETMAQAAGFEVPAGISWDDEKQVSALLDKAAETAGHDAAFAENDVLRWNSSDMIEVKLMKLAVRRALTHLPDREAFDEWIEDLNRNPEKPVVYVPDNREYFPFQEIGIEALLRSGFTVLVMGREAPVLNDATYDWLNERLSSHPLYKKRLFVVSSGTDTAGLDLANLDAEANTALAEAGSVVSTGNTNYESLLQRTSQEAQQTSLTVFTARPLRGPGERLKMEFVLRRPELRASSEELLRSAGLKEVRPELRASSEELLRSAGLKEVRPELRAEMRGGIWKVLVALTAAAAVVAFSAGLPRGLQSKAGAQYKSERPRAYYDRYVDMISKENYATGPSYNQKYVPYTMAERRDALKQLVKAQKAGDIWGRDYDTVLRAMATGISLSADRLERAAYGNKDIDDLAKELEKKRQDGVKLSEDDDAVKAASKITGLYLAGIQSELDYQYETGQAILAMGMTQENLNTYVTRLIRPSVYKGYQDRFEKDLYPKYFLADPNDKELKRVKAALTAARDKNIDALKNAGVSATLEKQYTAADKAAKAAKSKVETLETELADATSKTQKFAEDLERQRRLLNGDRDNSSVKGFVQAKEELVKEQKQLERDKKFAEARKLEETIQSVEKDIRDTKRKEQEASDGRAREEKRMRQAQSDLRDAKSEASRLEKAAKDIEDTFAEVRDALEDRKKRSELRELSENDKRFLETFNLYVQRRSEHLLGDSGSMRTDKGIFVPSVPQEVLAILREVLRGGETFVDLGAGIGSVAALASHAGAAQAFGVESDQRVIDASPEFLEDVQFSAEHMPVGMTAFDKKNVTLVQGDLMTADLATLDGKIPGAAQRVYFYYAYSRGSQSRESNLAFLEVLKKLPAGSLVILYGLREGAGGVRDFTAEDLKPFGEPLKKFEHGEGFYSAVYRIKSELRVTPNDRLFLSATKQPTEILLHSLLDETHHQRRTRDGIFVPSVRSEVLGLLRAVMQGGETFVDLGSGIGTVVALASHVGAARAYGAESDGLLARLSGEYFESVRGAAGPLPPGVTSFNIQNVETVQGDFMQMDLGTLDGRIAPDARRVYFYYAFSRGSQSRENNLALLRKIQKLPAGSLVIFYSLSEDADHVRDFTAEDLRVLGEPVHRISHGDGFYSAVYRVPERQLDDAEKIRGLVTAAVDTNENFPVKPQGFKRGPAIKAVAGALAAVQGAIEPSHVTLAFQAKGVGLNPRKGFAAEFAHALNATLGRAELRASSEESLLSAELKEARSELRARGEPLDFTPEQLEEIAAFDEHTVMTPLVSKIAADLFVINGAKGKYIVKKPSATFSEADEYMKNEIETMKELKAAYEAKKRSGQPIPQHFNVRFGQWNEKLGGLIMPYLDGENGYDWFEDQNHRFKHQYHYFGAALQVASTVAVLHSLGFVHRDLKLDNFFVTDKPILQLFLIDFNLAYHHSSGRPVLRGATKGYASPEQWREFESGIMVPHPLEDYLRQDVYSLGVTLLRLWLGGYTGSEYGTDLHFTNMDPGQILEQVDFKDVPIKDILQRALDTDPKRRWPNAIEMEKAIRARMNEVRSGLWKEAPAKRDEHFPSSLEQAMTLVHDQVDLPAKRPDAENPDAARKLIRAIDPDLEYERYLGSSASGHFYLVKLQGERMTLKVPVPAQYWDMDYLEHHWNMLRETRRRGVEDLKNMYRARDLETVPDIKKYYQIDMKTRQGRQFTTYAVLTDYQEPIAEAGYLAAPANQRGFAKQILLSLYELWRNTLTMPGFQEGSLISNVEMNSVTLSPGVPAPQETVPPLPRIRFWTGRLQPNPAPESFWKKPQQELLDFFVPRIRRVIMMNRPAGETFEIDDSELRRGVLEALGILGFSSTIRGAVDEAKSGAKPELRATDETEESAHILTGIFGEPGIENPGFDTALDKAAWNALLDYLKKAVDERVKDKSAFERKMTAALVMAVSLEDRVLDLRGDFAENRATYKSIYRLASVLKPIAGRPRSLSEIQETMALLASVMASLKTAAAAEPAIADAAAEIEKYEAALTLASRAGVTLEAAKSAAAAQREFGKWVNERSRDAGYEGLRAVSKYEPSGLRFSVFGDLVTLVAQASPEISYEKLLAEWQALENKREDGGSLTAMLTSHSDVMRMLGIGWRKYDREELYGALPDSYYRGKDVLVMPAVGNVLKLLKDQGAKSVTAVDKSQRVIDLLTRVLNYASVPEVAAYLNNYQRFQEEGPIAFERGGGPPVDRILHLMADGAEPKPLEGVRAVQGDVFARLPLEDSSVDFVLVPYLMGVPNGVTAGFYKQAMQELLRVLRPGGRIVIMPAGVSGFGMDLLGGRGLAESAAAGIASMNTLDDFLHRLPEEFADQGYKLSTNYGSPFELKNVGGVGLQAKGTYAVVELAAKETAKAAPIPEAKPELRADEEQPATHEGLDSTLTQRRNPELKYDPEFDALAAKIIVRWLKKNLALYPGWTSVAGVKVELIGAGNNVRTYGVYRQVAGGVKILSDAFKITRKPLSDKGGPEDVEAFSGERPDHVAATHDITPKDAADLGITLLQRQSLGVPLNRLYDMAVKDQDYETAAGIYRELIVLINALLSGNRIFVADSNLFNVIRTPDAAAFKDVIEVSDGESLSLILPKLLAIGDEGEQKTLLADLEHALSLTASGTYAADKDKRDTEQRSLFDRGKWHRHFNFLQILAPIVVASGSAKTKDLNKALRKTLKELAEQRVPLAVFLYGLLRSPEKDDLIEALDYYLNTKGETPQLAETAWNKLGPVLQNRIQDGVKLILQTQDIANKPSVDVEKMARLALQTMGLALHQKKKVAPAFLFHGEKALILMEELVSRTKDKAARGAIWTGFAQDYAKYLERFDTYLRDLERETSAAIEPSDQRKVDSFRARLDKIEAKLEGKSEMRATEIVHSWLEVESQINMWAEEFGLIQHVDVATEETTVRVLESTDLHTPTEDYGTVTNVGTRIRDLLEGSVEVELPFKLVLNNGFEGFDLEIAPLGHGVELLSELREASQQLIDFYRGLGEFRDESVDMILKSPRVFADVLEETALDVRMREDAAAGKEALNHFASILTLRESLVVDYRISPQDLLRMKNPEAVVRGLLKTVRDAVSANKHLIVRITVPAGLASKLDRIYDSMGLHKKDVIRRRISGSEITLYNASLPDASALSGAPSVTVGVPGTVVSEGKFLASDRYDDKTQVTYRDQDDTAVAGKLFTAALIVGAEALSQNTVNGLAQYETDHFRARSRDALDHLTSLVMSMLGEHR